MTLLTDREAPSAQIFRAAEPVGGIRIADTHATIRRLRFEWTPSATSSLYAANFTMTLKANSAFSVTVLRE